jgi:hypothetical protein
VSSQRRPRKQQQRNALPVARNKLLDAISDLAHTRRHTIRLEGGKLKRVKLAPRYTDLAQAVAAHRGGHGGQWSGQFPFWADALVLLTEIDAAVVEMHPEPHRWPGWTIPRLHALEARRWRPQDCPLIHAHAGVLAGFTAAIDAKFAPRPVTLPDPCPSCGVDVVYRDRDGEEVRGPALQITDAGAACGACDARWPPEKLPMLGRMLGYPGHASLTVEL